MEDLALRAERRTAMGKRVRALRRQGLVPANLYWRRQETIPLQFPQRELENFLAHHHGTAVVRISFNGQERPALIKHIQRHPTSDRLLHVTFQQVALTEKLRAEVPLHFVGEAPAAKARGGTLLHNLTAVEVEALPHDLPSMLEVDVSSLVDFDAAIHVRDLTPPAGVTILEDPEELVAKVVPPAVEAEGVEEAAPTPEVVGEAREAAAGEEA